MSKQYTILVNFSKPWRVRCRSDLDKYKKHGLYGNYQIGSDGIWYEPVYTGSKSEAERIASTLKTISKSM